VSVNERVPIWNAFFQLAWEQAKGIHELSAGRRNRRAFRPAGGTLPEIERRVLAAVVLCNLMIEARANHLIEELVESGRVSNDVGQAARFLPPKHKWFLLPTLAGGGTTLQSTSGPHQAVAQVCDLRNDALHVKYGALRKRLPNPGSMLSYFERIVAAMEDMNVVLGRVPSARPEVLKIGRFPRRRPTGG
jgi:hypothetical protein